MTKQLLPPSEICKRLLETNDPFYLTVEEVALFLRCTMRTVRNYLAEGKKFPNTRTVADGYRIAAADVRVLLGVTISDKPASAPAIQIKRSRGPGFVGRW